jgi:hypothetical protein
MLFLLPHIHMVFVGDLLNRSNFFINTQLAVVNAVSSLARMFPTHHFFAFLFRM